MARRTRREKIEIIGLPDPLIASQSNIKDNFYLVDDGLGWSADGREVIHVVQRFGAWSDVIQRINIDTREVHPVSPYIFLARSLQTSPSGEYLTVTGSPDSSISQTLLYAGRAPEYALSPVDNVDPCLPYVWSRDSRLVAYAVPGGGIKIRDVVSNTRVASLDRRGVPLAFSPDDGELLVGESQQDTLLALRSLRLSQDSVTEWGTVEVARAWSCNWPQVVWATWDVLGIRVVYKQCNGLNCSIELFSSPGGPTGTLVRGESLNLWRVAGGSPQGRSVALWLEEHIPTSFLGGYGRDHLYLADPSTGALRLLANWSGDTRGGSVAFSPDGTDLAFFYNANEAYDGHQMGAAPPTGIYRLRVNQE